MTVSIKKKVQIPTNRRFADRFDQVSTADNYLLARPSYHNVVRDAEIRRHHCTFRVRVNMDSFVK